MLLNGGVGEDSWKSLALHGDPTSASKRKSVLNLHWKNWCWSWNSNTLATWWEELTHWKRLWCWERLRARGEGDDRGWDGWMASPTQWTWVWASSGCWWWTGRPCMLQSMGSQRVRHVWATELNWSALKHMSCINNRHPTISVYLGFLHSFKSRILSRPLPEGVSSTRSHKYLSKSWGIPLMTYVQIFLE